MQLGHLNLATSDVIGLAAFFERFFGKRSLERGSGAFALISNDEDFVLTLMKAKTAKKHDPVAYPETFHVGFYVDDAAAVEPKRDELAAAGFSPGEIHDASRSGRRMHFLLHRSRQCRCRDRHAAGAASDRGQLSVGESDNHGAAALGRSE